LTAVIARAAAAPVRLCVGVLPLQQSDELGQATQWAVSAWATGGNVPDATIRLQTSAGAGAPSFSFGCGSGDGSALCDLGAVDAGSAQRQLQAQFTVPLSAATVASASLTAIGSATGLHTDPKASASVSVLAPSTPVGVGGSLPTVPPIGVSAPPPTLSPGGNAADLFPTLSPTSPATGSGATGGAPTGSGALGGTRQVADTAALSAGASHAGAEAAGLGALALAFLLAVTRLSIRRPAAAAPGTAGAAAPPPEAPAEPAGEPEGPQAPPSAPGT
jgi:hypothetical protein